MAHITNHGMPVIKRNNNESQNDSPKAKNSLHFPHKVKNSGTDMNSVFPNLFLADPLLVLGFPAMGNNQEFTGQESMDNSTEKNNAGDKIKRILLNSIFQYGIIPVRLLAR